MGNRLSPHRTCAQIAATARYAISTHTQHPVTRPNRYRPTLLAAAVDPITLLIDTIQASTDNLEALVGAVADNPLPIISQVLANVGTYVSELPDIGVIFDQLIGNVGNAVRSPFAVPVSCSDAQEGPCENISAVPVTNAIPIVGALSQQQIFALLPGILPEDLYASLKPILDFTTSPISGTLLSLIGPVIAPVLSVVSSVGAVIDYLGESDFQSALFELINLPTNAIGALLNGGQFLNLTPVLSLLGVTLPDTVKSIGFNMGGLLSPGGVMFDGLAAEVDIDLGLGTVRLSDPGLPVGPIGSLIGLTNYVAKSIVVTPPAEAPVQIAAAAEAPVVEAVEVAAPTAVTDSGPEVAAVAVSEPAEAAPASAPAEVADPVSAPAQEVADAADTTPSAPRASSRSGRGGEAASSAGTGSSTPKRAARGAASRG